jgi:hypothetical protein
LADETRGLYFETHLNDWDFIASLLSPDSVPQREDFNIDVTGDAGSNSLVELREVNPIPNDPNKPVFYIGSTTNKQNLHFDISAKFAGIDSNYSKYLDFTISHDSTLKGNILPSMLGFEKLKEMLIENSEDTSAIVKLAIQYNLLCDYTALIALEPNDTLHFMKNPFDEDKLVFVELDEEADQDSLNLEIYPNPFNSQTKIKLDILYSSKVNINIYNIRGQLVKELANKNAFEGSEVFTWDGRNSSFQNVSSGLYFVSVQIINNQTKDSITKVKRIILVR